MSNHSPYQPSSPFTEQGPFRPTHITNCKRRCPERPKGTSHLQLNLSPPTSQPPPPPPPPHFTTPREVVVIFLGGNDLANLATDQHLKNALLNPAPPLNKLLIQITIFNITSRLIDIYNYFKAFCKHVKICKLIRRPSMSDFLKPLVIAINSQLNNRLPNNTLIDTYNSITTHYICTDRTHLKKSGQDLIYRKIKHAIRNPKNNPPSPYKPNSKFPKLLITKLNTPSIHYHFINSIIIITIIIINHLFFNHCPHLLLPSITRLI